MNTYSWRNWLCLFCGLFSAVSCVKIRSLDVPYLVELGGRDVLLDCDYEYEDREKMELEIKWYFNKENTPFYQWLPGRGQKPQIIGDRFRGLLNLDHVTDHVDPFKRHRALMIKKPDLTLAGEYTCKVSSLFGEDTRWKEMIVYSPARSVNFEQNRSPWSDEVNVTCIVQGVYPRPRIILTWGKYQLDDSEASVTSHSLTGSASDLVTYDVIVHRAVPHAQLKNAETLFGCELTIPGTDYRVRQEAIYSHRGASYSHPASRVSGVQQEGPRALFVAVLCLATFTLF